MRGGRKFLERLPGRQWHLRDDRVYASTAHIDRREKLQWCKRLHGSARPVLIGGEREGQAFAFSVRAADDGKELGLMRHDLSSTSENRELDAGPGIIVATMEHLLPDADICERARQSRDARFDGRFFIAVVTTGIFCRTVCPARTPARENVRYYPSVAAALAAGYRPCLRCRPERAPVGTLRHARSPFVVAALERIDAGGLDDRNIVGLGAELGISARQLTRLFMAEVGSPPGAVARARRLTLARQLIDDTTLSFMQIAHLAGFGSLRRFNEAVVGIYGRAPRDLRRQPRRQVPAAQAAGVRLRLALRPPYNIDWVRTYFQWRAIPGVESCVDGVYRRTLDDGELRLTFAQTHVDLLLDRCGVPAVAAGPAGAGSSAASGASRLGDILLRVQRMLDLSADGATIDAHLSEDTLLAGVVAAHPGLRVPGCWDPFELAVRAILGQQVNVAGATTLAGRLVAKYGEQIAEGRYRFPSPVALAKENCAAIGMPGRRGEALRLVAQAVAEGTLRFDQHDAAALAAQLVAIPGIGPWTAQYIAMRALGDPDAFPAEDIVLRKAIEPAQTLSARALRERAQAWRPWRAYAVMYLWKKSALARTANLKGALQ